MVPTSGWEFMVAGEWITLNASAGKIPSTEDFQQAPKDQAFLSSELAVCPLGWTWAKQPMWYADHYHWDAWTVVDCFADENNKVPWYFSEGSILSMNSNGKFYFNFDLR